MQAKILNNLFSYWPPSYIFFHIQIFYATHVFNYADHWRWLGPYCLFAFDVTAAMFAGQEHKHISPVGTEIYFYVHS